MGVKVTVNSVPKKQNFYKYSTEEAGDTVNVIPPGAFDSKSELRELNDVDASDLDNNEVLVYDETADKFVVKEIPVVNGGTF